MPCQYVECNAPGEVKRMALRGETPLWYCADHDPLSDETDADPDLWTEVDDGAE